MSFDPDSFAPSNDRGRKSKRDAYDFEDEYEGNDSQRDESRFRPVPLALTVIFGLIAIVAVALTFNLSGETLTTAEQTTKGYIALAGFLSFGIAIFTVRKVKRR